MLNLCLNFLTTELVEILLFIKQSPLKVMSGNK